MNETVFGRIVELLRTDQLVVFVGPDLSQRLTGAPGWPEMAQALAGERGYDGLRSWPAVASRYESALARQDLIDWLVNRLSGKEPGPLYKALAALSVENYVSASYDDLLQQALREHGRSVYSVVERKDLNFLKADRATVVKLFGEVEVSRGRWSDLLLTSTEIRGLPTYRESILKQQVYPLFEGKTVLIIGQDLEADYFQNIYYHSAPQDDRLRRRTYALCSGLEDWQRETWSDSQLTIIEAEPLAFLQRLLEAAGSDMGVTIPARLDAEGEEERTPSEEHGMMTGTGGGQLQPETGQQSVANSDLSVLARILAQIPDFNTVDGRIVILRLSGVADVVEGIDLNGAPRTVASRMVIALNDYGTLESGESALGLLLQYVASQPDLPPSSKSQIDLIVDKYDLVS